MGLCTHCCDEVSACPACTVFRVTIQETKLFGKWPHDGTLVAYDGTTIWRVENLQHHYLVELRSRVLFLSSKPVKIVAEKAQLVWHWRHLCCLELCKQWLLTRLPAPEEGPRDAWVFTADIGQDCKTRGQSLEQGYTPKDVSIRPKWTLGWPQGQREGPQSCNTWITWTPHHLLWELRPAQPSPWPGSADSCP